MNRYGKRCVLYPRVSTEMQVDGYSLEGQKNMLTRFADREEMIVVDTYEDAGKSGKSIEGRPAFQKMLRDIEDGLDIDYILVYKLSRFGRNAADILNSLELVQSYGVNLICIEEGIDSSQTSGKLLISVLSAVAEIERENIIEQTMNGRREKARQGGWNGGFAPYGYTLEDNKLMIEETEAVAIRKIFELYTSSEIGLGGIANQLNLQGIRKIPRQNGTLEDWTGHFIKLILDNPVYCGKIAYGRRTKEKVKGTKNDYQMKRNDDYILTEGQHKGIVSEEVWEKAHAKRLRTGVKQPSKIGRDRVHLLSGLLKCPVCGSPMYTNKHAWTNKDGTYKEIYYYVCSRNRMVRGKHCEYKAMLKKTDIEPMVIEAIREIVRNEEYAQAIKKRIGVQIDTKAVDKELEGYQAKLKEVDLNKTRLEREIDSLPADAKYRERKLHDMTLRLDSLYDVIVELEEKIEDARLRRDAIKQQAITLENIYKIMVNFDCVYNIINDEEKRNVVTALIKEIEIYRNDESEYPLKRIGLNFPVFKDGGEVTELLWDKGNTVETVDGMSIQKIDRMIELLREEKYQWKPARREYIPKKNGKKRPLGIPTWGDKLLQEVMREILEAYYEPQFSNHSHGFRPNRGCHTALQEIQIWKGTRWFIEGDISKYFDTIDHDVLLKILEKNIHDGRFLRLISNMLKAGYLDDWKFNQTISGAPQGGVISPLLANIYLNEFDQWIENTLIPQYTKGKRQKSNPAYNRMNAEISKARKNRNIQTAHKLEVERRNIPSVDPYDENYRRCRYVRYADDFLIGFTGSKADAEEIKAAMHNFLENELRLELSQEKTLITNASSQAAKFLGYEIKAQRANDYIDPKGRRGANGAIALLVPAKVIESKCQSFKRNGKVTHRNALLQDDDFSIVQQFQAEYRGLVQYYILAQNLSWFSTLYWVMETSLLKTLACKHRSSMKKQKKKYRTTTTSTSGKEVPCLQVVVPRPGKKPLVATWGGISLVRKRKAIIEDKPYKVYGGRTELVKRLLADTCELCGSKENIEVHHIRKLADVKNKGLLNSPTWAQVMAAGNRKTLVVCRECHVAIHNGTINKPLS